MIRPSNFSSRSTGPGDERAASSRRLSLSHPSLSSPCAERRERVTVKGVVREGLNGFHEGSRYSARKLFLDESAIVPAAS